MEVEMACPNDYKAIMDRGTRAFNATLKDMECVLIGYKNEIFRLNNELAKEKRKNARLEAKLNGGEGE